MLYLKIKITVHQFSYAFTKKYCYYGTKPIIDVMIEVLIGLKALDREKDLHLVTQRHACLDLTWHFTGFS